MKKLKHKERYSTHDKRTATLLTTHYAKPKDAEGNQPEDAEDILIFGIEDGEGEWPMRRGNAEAWIKAKTSRKAR